LKNCISPSNLHLRQKKIVSLKSFHKYSDTSDALVSTTALLDGKMSKQLKKFLQSSITKKNISDSLAVADKSLGTSIKKKLGISCVSNSDVMELFRCIRFQLNDLLSEDLEGQQMHQMALGLAHSLGRYKLKFTPDKVDVMIVQAVSLLEDLDKEINTYSMRIKEWYGWHFPELVKFTGENELYARTVKTLGNRKNIEKVDLTDVLPEDVATSVKMAATISMGSEITDDDIRYIQELCNQVIDSFRYRDTLTEYIQNRMRAIAPNLTVIVGEILGAKLIAHAGSLINLAKYPASTVQIIGAEKALFRALKTKQNTPKYGIIYHASLVGKATAPNKGKVSRVLANKTVLSARVDALGDENTRAIGLENLMKVQGKVNELEGGAVTFDMPTITFKTYEKPVNVEQYNPTEDIEMAQTKDQEKKSSNKRKRDDNEEPEEGPQKKKTKKEKEKKVKKDKKKKSKH